MEVTGMGSASGSHALLPRVVGISAAADFTLVDAREWAHDLAAHTSPPAVAVSKRQRRGVNRTLDQANDHETELFLEVVERSDAVEGGRSFLERRPTRFDAPDLDLARGD